jgi:hypothetical protein
VVDVYLRFVSSEIDPYSCVEAGLFVAARDLRESGTLPFYDYERLWELFDWFNEYLKRPHRFSRSRRCGDGPGKAVCWFKPTAREHIACAREMVALLEDYGVPIWTLKTPKVGYVVYEDEHQVVAEPYADTRLRS